MKYSEVIRELEYWREMSGEKDPEVVVNDDPYSHKIDIIQPVKGIENSKALGIVFNDL